MGNRQSDCGFVERGGDKVARSRWARTMSACAARALRGRGQTARSLTLLLHVRGLVVLGEEVRIHVVVFVEVSLQRLQVRRGGGRVEEELTVQVGHLREVVTVHR